ELANATLTELGNMISGRAVTKLAELGYKFDVTPPAIFIGSSTIGDIVESLIVPIDTSLGSFKINVALRER
ncbi:MAG: chemotaxis protein CheC, partial [Spirochaetales bacterium]|nr:chemotaxis protein CheC [Spirochaetales bacterium]